MAWTSPRSASGAPTANEQNPAATGYTRLAAREWQPATARPQPTRCGHKRHRVGRSAWRPPSCRGACSPAAGRALHQRGLPRGNAATEQERAPGDAPANARTIPEQAMSLASHTSPPPHGKTPASPARAVAVVIAQFAAGKDDNQPSRHARRTAASPRATASGRASGQTPRRRRFRSSSSSRGVRGACSCALAGLLEQAADRRGRH
jgi:hypothetical protein